MFLPRNQPLYALSCSAIVPAFLSERVLIKRPSAYNNILEDLLSNLKLSGLLGNIQTYVGSREDFLHIINNENHSRLCGGRVVIFTGTGGNAHVVSQQISKKILFIANGSAHNPVVVSNDASLDQSIEGILRVKLYNSGQDCAAPNSILVHTDVYDDFVLKLKKALRGVGVGPYSNLKNKIGPLSDQKSIRVVQNLIACNKRWIDKDFPGSFINKSTMNPLLILRPLVLGGNYSESYAPVFFIQKYTDDCDLRMYFEHELYTKNAGYISVFGSSNYIYNLAFKKFGDGKSSRVLHPIKTILYNTHLHALGVERGVKPYGGYGEDASFVSFLGQKTYMPTLVQRDIFDFLIQSNV